MPNIAISYRRKDAPGMARLICEQLRLRYGSDHVFMDVDIPYGTNYRTHIEQVLRACDILLVVIGRRWLGGRKSRLNQSDDPVRLEIETARTCNNAIIPVLVDGARMPDAAQLPEDLKEFHFINAARVDAGQDFRSHIARLIAHIDKVIEAKRAPAAVLPMPAETGQPPLPPLPAPKSTPAAAPPNRLFSHLPAGISLARRGRSVAWILLAILCTYFLNRLEMLQGLERVVLDWEMTTSRRASGDIAIVGISDLEYDEMFGGRSPLDPVQLRNLINALARSKPKAIGIDIDTSHPQFRNFKPDPSWPPIVWERDILNAASGKEIEPADILGGQDPALNEGSGIPALLDDPLDKVTRLYSRCIDTKAGG